MSETAFPVNDLLRRKLQTGVAILSLTLCVASTLFLLFFSEKVGLGISLMVEDKLTAGFSLVFSRFIIFIACLIFLIGAAIISFIVFVMMAQRVRDIGLMKASGCPNDLIFGYFMTELLIVTFAGCLLGVFLGMFADFASTSLFNMHLPIPQKPINFWLILLVFVIFFVLAVFFGAKPILDAVKVEPSKAISPVFYFGLSEQPVFKIISKSCLTYKLALRNLFRRKSATIRIILCLATVSLLATVAVAGGIIADQTTKSWIEKAIGKDTILIGHQDMCSQYKLLLSKFYEKRANTLFNYTDEKYIVKESLLNRLRSMAGVIAVDARLITETRIREIPGYLMDPTTMVITSVGDNREGESLIVGVEPTSVLSEWFLDGEFLRGNQSHEAMLGDTIAQRMFTKPLNQSIRLFERNFDVVGVCVDSLNNGIVVYVPLKALQNATGITRPNIIMAKIDASANRMEILQKIVEEVKTTEPEFEVLELNEILERNLGFLGYIWSTIMLLPLFSLVAASLCLLGYVLLVLNEQRQEFGILRALGAKTSTIVKIISTQNIVVLSSSYAAGIAFGIIFTLLILVPKPIVTGHNILGIAACLLITLVALFICSLYPAIRFTKKRILEIIS
ncbi:MAG: FtsX-like permease family protein [Candidatus Bathyarchaeia archaeon]